MGQKVPTVLPRPEQMLMTAGMGGGGGKDGVGPLGPSPHGVPLRIPPSCAASVITDVTAKGATDVPEALPGPCEA